MIKSVVFHGFPGAFGFEDEDEDEQVSEDEDEQVHGDEDERDGSG